MKAGSLALSIFRRWAKRRIRLLRVARDAPIPWTGLAGLNKANGHWSRAGQRLALIVRADMMGECLVGQDPPNSLQGLREQAQAPLLKGQGPTNGRQDLCELTRWSVAWAAS